ncbi:MAG: hypothetical protein ACP5E4_01110 [Candidatus Aenigmatarchaeota archaeon]
MAIYQTEFFGNTTLGLVGVCTENMCYLPPEVPKRQMERISKTLGTPTKNLVLYNSFLLGLFCSANSGHAFIPHSIQKEEAEKITEKKAVRLAGVFNTIGNLILCNDKGCLLSPYLGAKKAYFEEKLGLKTNIVTIANLPFPGIGACATNTGCLVHKNALDAEIGIIEKTLGVEAKRCEFYEGFPGTEILGNSKGLIVSKLIRGQVLAEIQEGLKVF